MTTTQMKLADIINDWLYDVHFEDEPIMNVDGGMLARHLIDSGYIVGESITPFDIEKAFMCPINKRNEECKVALCEHRTICKLLRQEGYKYAPEQK